MKKNPTKPRRTVRFDQIAETINQVCHRRMPDGLISGGILAGMESEIRQRTLINLYQGFLTRNPDYRTAIDSGCKTDLQNCIEKSVAISMHYIKLDLTRELAKYQYRNNELSDAHGGSTQHPCLLSPHEWDIDRKSEILMRAVRDGVRGGSISPENAAIVEMICVQGMRVKHIASTLGVSPSAVSQRVKRVIQAIPRDWD